MSKGNSKTSRRAFLERSSVALAAAAAPTLPSIAAPAENVAPVPRTQIKITVNGKAHSMLVEDRWTLNELLRDHLDLTGTKIGCDRGECGACTVLIDGKAGYSCSHLAAWMDGEPIVPTEPWFKRFETFTLCGEGELVKTVLTAKQTAIGEEVD